MSFKTKDSTQRKLRTAYLVRCLKPKCSRCEESHPACLEFHHRDVATKLASISDAVWRLGWSYQRILDEIEKCDVVCVNCHRKEHWSGNYVGFEVDWSLEAGHASD